MVLHPDTLDLLAEGPDLLAALGLDACFKTELPASQIEIAARPAGTIADLAHELMSARRRLAEAIGGRARLAVAGAHPFAQPSGLITDLERYRHTLERYGPVARRQLICGLHVHVTVPGGQVLRVHNALRSYLPEIAALAANAPIFEGADTSMASIRPQISTLLPRQGVPPAIPSWEWLASQLEWGLHAGSLSRTGEWWWELRLNVVVGTLEIRVPDAQTTVEDAMAVTAFVAALVRWLAERDDVGDPAPDWRINENRWSAARFGVAGTMADLDSGAVRPTRDRILQLIDEVSGFAPPGGKPGLEAARRLVEDPPAERQRAVMRRSGARGVAEWLAGRFLEPPAPTFQEYK